MIMADYNFMCSLEHYRYININCEDNDYDESIEMSKCNVSIVDMSCSDQNYQTWSKITFDKPTTYTPAECKCTSVSENSASETTSVVTNDGRSTSNCSNSIIVGALGALVGLLLVLLVTVTATLTWTCWLLKKWKGMKFNAEYQLRYTRVRRINQSMCISVSAT